MPALPLPNGFTQFLDILGKPLVAGTVAHYEPGGLTPRDTWQDFNEQILNDNPLTLDARGQAAIWGSGRYRQIVTDSLGNIVWDAETATLSTQPYEVGFYFIDDPNANDVICVWNFTQGVTFPTDFSGSVGSVNVNPSDPTDFAVKLNGASAVGTMTVSAAGDVTFVTSLTNPAFTQGQRLTVHVGSGGANGATGIAATFLGAIT